MGARTPPRCRRAARRRSRGRGRHAVRARRVSRAAFGSSPFAPAVRDAVRAAIRARVAPPYTGLAGWRPLWRDAREFFGARGRRRAWTSYQVLLCAVRTDWAACGRKKWAALSSCGLRGLLAGLFARVRACTMGLIRHGGTPEAQNRRGTSPEVPRSLRMATY